MAKFFNTFALLSLAVCVMLATSAPTVHVYRRATSEAKNFKNLKFGLEEVAIFLEGEFLESNRTIEKEFNVTHDHVNETVAMCRLVAYYYLVEAVDNSSNIHYYLKQNALDAVAYWRTMSGSDSNMTLTEFGHKCQMTALHTLMHEINSTLPQQIQNFDECDWFKNLLQEQGLQGICSQLAKGRFELCNMHCNQMSS